jgi:hypothetical protein
MANLVYGGAMSVRDEPPRDLPVPDEPAHPLHQLTTGELNTYRRELEHALKVLPGTATVRELIAEHLGRVRAEQESRQRIHDASGPNGK